MSIKDKVIGTTDKIMTIKDKVMGSTDKVVTIKDKVMGIIDKAMVINEEVMRRGTPKIHQGEKNIARVCANACH